MTCFRGPSPSTIRKPRPGWLALACIALFSIIANAGSARAQSDWSSDVEIKKTPKAANTTVIERASGKSSEGPKLTLVALLTADGQEIDQGLIWRVYQDPDTSQGKAKLITENREASPTLKLAPGEYTINASFGRAHITHHVTLKTDSVTTEKFVLNAGGLRLTAVVAGKPAPKGAVTYAIYTDDRDQFDNRATVMSAAKPDLIMRLNAGIYHIVSTYGDANARIEADVTVEAGKLTEATVTHSAGRATFHLANHPGGEALPDTHWTILSESGEVVKESVGALPTHTLAPGSYTVRARWNGLTFTRKFAVANGETTIVEVVKNNSGVQGDGSPGAEGEISVDLAPGLDVKNQ
jgi:hypothetical protein